MNNKKNPRRRSMLNHSYGAGQKKYFNDQREYELSLSALDNYYPREALDENSFEIYPELDGKYREYTDTEKTFLNKVGDFFFGESPASFKERLELGFNPINMWNMWNIKRVGADRTSKEFELELANDRLDELKNILRYSDLIKERQTIYDQIKKGEVNPADVLDRLIDIQNDLSQLNAYFQTSGKKSNIVTDLLYNTNKIDWSDTNDLDLKLDILGLDLAYNRNTPQSATERLGSVISNLFKSGELALLNLGDFISGKPSDRFVKRALLNSSADNRLYDRLFVDYSTNTKDLDILDQRILQWGDYLERDKLEKLAKVIETENKYTLGSWAFDPRLVDPRYKSILEQTKTGFLGWLDPTKFAMMIPETGSSWSDIKNFTGLMMVNYGAETLGSLATLALTRNPEAAMTAVSGIRLGAAGTTLGLTAAMRRHETNSEAMDAQSSKVLNESIKNGVDIESILNQTKDYSKLIGINTDGLSELELLLLAIAYNVPTDDATFEKIKKDSRKGLNKVINENNALAVVDYLEALPFMNFTGSFFRDAAAAFKPNKLRTATIYKLRNDGMGVYDLNKPVNTFRLLDRDELVENTVRRLSPDFEKAVDASFNGVLDRAITRVADKFGNDIASKLKWSHGLKFLKRKAQQLVPLATKEGIEEGQQQLLQSRYQRGEYEYYDKPRSMFDMPSLFKTPLLATDAVSAYFGINFGDPDNGDEELRKAMEIGAISGALFRAGHLASNLVSDEASRYVSWIPGINASDRDNVRGLVNQLRNDSALRQIVGESLGKYEDDQHIGIFFDAFSKRGINAERLANSLNELKNFKGNLVTDDYIDDDIRLMNVAWNAYKNPELNNILKDLNITKDSEQHKDLIKLATRSIVDYQNVKKLRDENNQQLDHFLYDILSASEDTDGRSEDDTDYILSKRNSSLDSIIRKIDESFESISKLINQERQAFVSSEEAANQAASRISQRRFNGIEQSDEIAVHPEEIAEEVQKIADEQFTIPSKLQYRRNRLITFFNLSKIRNSQAVRDMLKVQALRLKLLRDETGTDIDVDRLIGMIDALDRDIERMLSLAKESMSDINQQIKKQNEIRESLNKSLKKKDKLPLLKELTLEDVFKDYPQFENQNEIDKHQQLSALNSAILLVLQPIAEAYATGRTNPTLVKQTQRTLNWSELSDSQRNEYKNTLIDQWQQEGKGVPTDKLVRMQYLNEQKRRLKKFEELQKRFDKLVKDQASVAEEDRTFDMNADIDEVSRQAAQLLMSFDLAQKSERRKVAHRLWQQDSPITPADTEAAMDGNKEAQRKIDDVLNKIRKDETEDSILAQNSLDELPSDSFIGDSKVDVETLLPEDNGLEDALSEIMVDNAPETDAEKEAYKKLYGLLPEKRKKKAENKENIDSNQLLEDSADQLSNQDDSTDSSLQNTDGKITEPENIEISEEDENLNSETVDDSYLNLIDKDPIDSNDILKEAGVDTTNTVDVNPSLNENELDSDNDGDNGGSRELDDSDISEKNEQADLQEPLQEDLPAGNFAIDETEDGNLVINDMVISDEVATDLIEEQDLLSMFGLSMNLDSNDFYTNPESEDPRQLRSSEKAWTDYISLTFFYGYQEDVPPVLKANGQELKLNKPLKSGKELSEKLSKNGWFKSVKKYYVVCGGVENNSSHNANDLTVALILEDEEACYATFLRTPDSIVRKQSNGVRMTGLEYIKSKLRFIGVDVDKYKTAIQDARELYYHNHKVRQPIDTGRISQEELQKQIKKWQKDARLYYEQLSLDDPEQAKEKRLIEYDARNRAKIGIRNVLTEEQIQEQIDKLIEARNKIISAYCIKQADGTYVIPTKDGFALTHIHPENPRISNGKFNTNLRTNGLPTFKKLTGEDGGFGLSEDLEKLTELLNNRDVEFGYGTGRNGENPYSIVDFIGDDGSIQYDGVGHSGKIYVMVEGPGGVKVPVMLREERFNTQEGLGFIHRQKDNLVLAIDPSTGKMQPEKGLPSAAEVILYMITGKLNVDHMPAGYTNVMKPLVDLFVHNGEDTLMTINGNKLSLLNKFKFFADKRFAWLPFGRKELYRLAIVTKNQLGNRVLKYYTAEDLFGTNSEEVRKEVVYTIAENMHWNTEKADMKEKMDPKILDALRTYFNTYKDATEFRICGLEQLSFKKSDLFELDKKGNIKRSKDISVFAWMLANGKILTDLQSDHFKDPFVFANGVKVDEDVAAKLVVEQNQISKKSKEKNKPKKQRDEISSVIDATATISAKQEEIERFKSRFGVRSKDAEALIAKSEENRKAILEQYNVSPGVQKHGGMRDIVVLDINPSEIKSAGQEERSSKLKEQLNAALSKYIKHLSENGVHVAIENITISSDATSPQIMKQVVNNKIVPVLSMYNDGTGNVRLIQASELLGTIRGVTGVFSKIKSGGKLNQSRARNWLKNVLGLDDSQIIIQNGIWKAASDELVYGITDASVDVLSDQFEGRIRLSKQGGRGVHYHEAWHYINLLLHSPKERAYIYRKYIESHTELKHATFKEIEEAMAEDFRKYMEMKNEYNISNILRRVGNAVLNFINVFKKQDEIQYIYESIRKGAYARSTQLDSDSLNEFKRRFPNGVYQASYVIPGVPGHVIEKLTNITNPATFYQVGQSLAHKLIDRYDLKTIGDIKSVQSGLFRLFIEDLRLQNENDGNPLIDDIINNPEAFKHIIYSMFKQYGIEPKFKRIKKGDVTSTNPENDSEDAQKAEDRAENVWDIDNLLISLKDNVAFRAKLFLSRQKKTHFAWDETGQRYLEDDYDTLLNTPMYLGYSEAWVSILQNLWNIESFDNRDKDGNFESSSMRGIVKRLALSLPFFAELDRRLDTLYDDEGNPDVELINQIYCTVKKSNPQVAFFELRDAIEKSSYFGMYDLLLEGELTSKPVNKNKADRNKEWTLQNSNALRAVRNLPRLWSKTAMVSGMVTVNDRGETVVNSRFVDALYDVLDNGEIWGYVDKPKRKKSNSKYPTTSEEMELVYEHVSDSIVKVLNLMGISSDREVFDYYIQKHLQNPNDFGNPEKRFLALCQVLAKPSGKTAGNIRSLLAQLDKSIGYSEIQMSKGKTKPIDQVYYGYKADSEISKYAEAYNEVYPSASDFSVIGPDGSTIYPISENNHMSDELRGLNYNTNGKIETMQKSPYCLNSLILKLASEINHESPTKDEMFKLNAFVGLKDSEKQLGKDYFGITPLEDYIAKMEMTFRNMIVLPTMADKKTWYAIEQRDIVLPHDLITYDLNSENGTYLARRFSNRTLNIFAGYFIDELNSLEQYYSRENIQYLVNNPKKAIVNFHGAIKNGRMTFDGNGGKFRYFYEILFIELDRIGQDTKRYVNLNQYLEFMYNKQKEIENDPVSYGGLAQLREHNNPNEELDGFELVRDAIKEIRSKFLSDTEESKRLLYDSINRWLMRCVDEEVYALAQDGDLQIGQYKLTLDNVIKFAATAIPRHILDYYSKEFLKAGLFAGRMRPYYALQYDYDFTLSAIANHVASTMISIIETEKIFTGDPAYYKWKNIDKKSKYSQTYVSIDGFITTVSNLKEKHSDKIKRLGSVLSPGANLRTQYSEEEMNNIYGIKGSKYTVMNISDITAKSLYIDELKTSFGRLALIDYVRQNPPSWWNEYVENSGKKESAVISSLYKKDSEYEKLKLYAEQHDAEFAALLSERTNMAIAPYNYDKSIGHKGITVADAEVIIRPALYRKIRISLGEWTFTPDEDGYSDEEAYNIIESDPNWMYDEEKYKKVSKLELYPLKMTYFSNGTKVISYSEQDNIVNYQNVPVYNKMAIFPAFKFAFSSDTGMALYDRMNMSGNEIDMIAFESAVKVGDNQGKWSPFEDGVDNLDNFNDGLNSRSNQYIKDGNVYTNTAENGEDLLPILIQDLNGLRLQLNTESHTATERGLGTQAFKIMFSNIVDEDDYGSNKTDDDGNLKATRKGRLIKEDIMSCIHALTMLGVASVQEEFYDSGGKLKPAAVQNWVRRIAKNNGLGISAEEILLDGVVASLMSRKVFENGVSSLVNKEIVDINTTGGTAVLQSVFGFVGYGKRNVISEEYYVRNNGENLKWNKYDGSMEVILSLNFFRHVVPVEYQNTPDRMRQWLIDHDVIKGQKSREYWEMSEEDVHLDQLLSTKTSDMNFSVRLLKILETVEATTLGDILDKKDIILSRLGNKLKVELEDDLESLNLSWDTKRPLINPTYSKPKPFGIGYRIPTQGMSSTFSFIVADVLPLQSGDVIIVPMEFTAQTGSDFDVDKLFLSTKSYTDGKLDMLSEKSEKKIKELFSKPSKNRAKLITEILFKESRGALLNRLINNYIDVISDVRMFANARQSIDVITNLIQDKVLTVVNKKSTQYARAGYELLPSFLEQTKMEFSTGKSGIGPFALNITNMALTQFMHLTMDFGENEFEFGRLDAIQDQDGLRISDWLSAMVNAHVDVAKDPYVFALNVNKETYNHVNFLLRAGKGVSTFTFIAQPILKKLARLRNTSSGLYGSNIDGKTKKRSKKDIYILLLLEAKNELNSVKNQIDSDDNLSDEEKSAWRIRIANILNNKVENSEWKYVFNTALGIYAILNPNSYRSKYMLLLALKAYDRIQKYADELSELVLVSLIDTKKFGNNIASQLNFKNRYELFKHTKRPVNWFIGSRPEKLDESTTTSAIARYFSTLFLDSKFYNATNYVRLILRKLTYTATEVYNDLFNSIFGEINGIIEYEDYSGEAKRGYNVVLNDDVVQAVGSAIDNIIRFRSLFKFGQSFKFRNNEQDYSGPIDFTCGGNIDDVNQKIERILFGNKNAEDELDKHDLFTNLSLLIHDIQQDPSSDIATGLVDINGNITNQFLLFLRPQTADEKFSIGRMLLRKSQMDVAVELKAMLISDFDMLLRHPSLTVRRIARDIAFYAYYSTYDTSTPNSFFDLVPRYYRSQYDYALKNGLNCSNDILITALISDIFDNIDSTSDARISESFLDLISRNYWYDDSIVPEYTESRISSKDSVHKGYEVKLVPNYVQNLSVYGIIMTRTSNNRPYIKIRKGDEVFLYRKVGNLYRNNKNGTVVTDYAVYFIVPKLGLHQGKIHQYEFYNGSKIASMFEENDLPDVFSQLPFGKNIGLNKEFENFFNDIKPDKKELKSGITYRFESNPKIILEGFYYESINMQSSLELLRNNDGTIKFVPTSDIDGYLSSLSDFIIDVNDSIHKDNSIKINSNDSIENIISAIKKKLGNRNTENNPLRLYISGSFEPKVTKKEIKDYIESKIRDYLEKEENPDEASERNRLKDIAEDEIRKQKQDEFISNLIISMISSGIYIDRLLSDGQPNIGESVARVGSLLSDEFATQQTDVVTIAVPRSFATNAEEYSDFISVFSNLESPVVMSQKEQLGVVNMKNIIDQTNEVLEQLDQEAKKIEDNITVEDSGDLQGGEIILDISLLLGGGDIVVESKKDIDATITTDASDSIDNPEDATDANDILKTLGC